MQYFSMIVPFLIVAAVLSVSDYLAALQSPRQLRIAHRICAVALISFIGFGTSSLSPIPVHRLQSARD